MTSLAEFPTHHELVAALRWQVEAGADEAIADAPIDRFAAPAPQPVVAPAATSPSDKPAPPQRTVAERTERVSYAPPPATAQTTAAGNPGDGLSAQALAASANTLDELRDALQRFDGCALKRTATNFWPSSSNT